MRYLVQSLVRGSGTVWIAAGIWTVTIDAVRARFAAEAGCTCRPAEASRVARAGRLRGRTARVAAVTAVTGVTAEETAVAAAARGSRLADGATTREIEARYRIDGARDSRIAADAALAAVTDESGVAAIGAVASRKELSTRAAGRYRI
jgi:hypothetical protein